MAKERPLLWTRFSYDDFFEDPAVVCMTNEEVGAYLRLLQAAWKTRGILPDDDSYLASISHMGTLWPPHRLPIGRAWFIHDGVWEQKRIVREYAEFLARHEIAAAYGEIGARKRWGAYRDPNGVAMLEVEGEKEKRRVLESKTESTPAYSENGVKAKAMIEDLAQHLRIK